MKNPWKRKIIICKCRLCSNRDKRVNHIISKSSKLVQKDFQTRYNWVGKVIHWELCKRSKFDHTDKLYMTFITKGFWTIVFIFIVISTIFHPICPPAFFRCMSNSETYMELWPTSFIESMVVTCSDSISHDQVQVLSIPILLLACSQDWTCNLQMIVSLEVRLSNHYRMITVS